MKRKGRKITVRLLPDAQAALLSLKGRWSSQYRLSDGLICSAITFLAEESKQYGLVSGPTGFRPMTAAQAQDRANRYPQSSASTGHTQAHALDEQSPAYTPHTAAGKPRLHLV